MSKLAPTTWTTAQTRSQFYAIALLRWHMLVNGFRRKGGAGELIARIIVYPILAGMAIGPSIGAGIAAYFFTAHRHLAWIAWLLWGTFAFCQLLNINLSQPGSTFDPTQLIRFPLRARTYVLIRLCFGLLTPANVIGTLIAFSIALGVIVAAPQLWLYTLLALALFSAANVLFSRMVFAWVDRWLSTRRAREVFTGLIFAFSIGIQWLNFTFNPAYNHDHTHSHDLSRRVSFLAGLYHRAHPLLAWLPPELTASSLVAARHAALLRFAQDALAVALYAAVFFLVFALRMTAEFRGENLSDAANAVSRPKKLTPLTADTAASRPVAAHFAAGAGRPAVTASGPRTILSPILSALIAKEFLYLRRNLGLFYAFITPVLFVFLFAGRLATRSGGGAWFFPAALAYSLMGIIPLSFNSFGMEGAGSQLYFYAPLRMKDIFLAKNLISILLVAVEIVAVLGIISYVASPPPLWVIAATLLWVAATLLVSLTVGNRRSLSAPKKIDLTRATRKQASGLSALISIGVFFAAVTLAAMLALAGYFLHLLWTLVPIFAVLAAAAFALYWRSLTGLDRYALAHREQLFEELCKAG
jgi:ABC-2 type transport system permease protein